MKETYPAALHFVLQSEGGYSNDPQDSGGPTNFGIIQREYDAYRKAKSEAVQSVREIQKSEVEDIYRSRYWNAVGGDVLPFPVDILMFDSAVNMGLGAARKLLRRSLGLPGTSGPIDAAVHTALAHECGSLAAVETRYLTARGDYYRAIVKCHPKDSKFLKGWLNRIDHLRALIAQLRAEGAK